MRNGGEIISLSEVVNHQGPKSRTKQRRLGINPKHTVHPIRSRFAARNAKAHKNGQAPGGHDRSWLAPLFVVDHIRREWSDWSNRLHQAVGGIDGGFVWFRRQRRYADSTDLFKDTLESPGRLETVSARRDS
jgi:hypothetical protein